MSTDISHHKRTIAHFDLDAFYVSCERELNPSLLKKAVAVSQYNPHGILSETHSSEIQKRLIVDPKRQSSRYKTGGGDRNGSMIAISYEARHLGVKRGDRGVDAIHKCPSLNIVQVPVKRGKADLTMYRNASNRIIECLVDAILGGFVGAGAGEKMNMKRNEVIVEKASIDEIYVDLSTPVNYMTKSILDWHQNQNCTRSEINESADVDADHHLRGKEFWKEVLRCAEELGKTTIGGIEELSECASRANRLSKDEVRKGSSCQVLELKLDLGSAAWWNRPLQKWTEIEIRLACGSALAANARETVRTTFRSKEMDADVYSLSCGISTNKTLAKLASGLKKPNGQTLINPQDDGALKKLFHPLKIGRLKGLGGKMGDAVSAALDVDTVGDLAKVPLTILNQKYPPADDERPLASYLYSISRGICTEEVVERTKEKSMSSGKTFRGALAFSSSNTDVVNRSLLDLVGGLLERLDADYIEHKRMPSLLSLSVKLSEDKAHMSTSTKAPATLSIESFLDSTKKLYDRLKIRRNVAIGGLTVTAGNFHDIACGKSSIEEAFQRSLLSPATTQKSSPKKQSLPRKKINQSPLLNLWEQKSIKETSIRRNTVEKKGIENDANHCTSKSENIREGSQLSPTHATSNQIDKNIMSQLPMAVQSEIRIAKMSRIGSSKRRQAKVTDNWFSAKKEIANEPSSRRSLHHQSSKTGGNAKIRGCTRKRKIETFFKSTANEQNGSHGSTFAAGTSSNDVVDPAVLAELPLHIQLLVRKDMEANKRIRAAMVKRR
mmetsp:Transcript_18898/g.28726  ORF Transcript_18898/g.28726 Transcript_18898/m.28726 type:complete len:780 (-) Transcript_18898:197-2536(-)|eukprot:CAMPEP_0194121494 /NCGR_PEP_ID=MMETSP0150-20130528/47309_1 /TAXON_ID=122233 /ORGANISM="Chaetoceros debilis, Strain MM31A-1" /LENGTH=779 /DNA_ID=CAMNT_0038813955 /DNA_START=53 /DNA_END=2392 /DNA_ORIENTATION=-